MIASFTISLFDFSFEHEPREELRKFVGVCCFQERDGMLLLEIERGMECCCFVHECKTVKERFGREECSFLFFLSEF